MRRGTEVEERLRLAIGGDRVNGYTDTSLWEPSQAETHENSGLIVYSLRELQENPEALRPPDPIIDRLVCRGRTTLLAGREKEGKSTFLSSAMAKMTRGESFLDASTEAGSCLWIGEEHPNDFARRLTQMNADPDRVHFAPIDNMPSDLYQRLDRLGSRLAEDKIDLLILDTLSRFALITRENDPDGWNEFYGEFLPLVREHGCGVVLVHHAAKDPASFIRGSTAIAAHADMVIPMSCESGSNVRKFKPRGRWRWENYDVEFDPETNSYELHSSLELSKELRVLDHVRENPGCSLRQIRNAVKGNNNAIDDILRVLQAGKKIENRGGEHRASYYPFEDSR